MVGVLVVLVAVTGYVLYRDGSQAGEDTTASVQMPLRGVVRIPVAAEQLGRLQEENPKLALWSDDGGKTLVLVWRVERGQIVMEQFHNLQAARYVTLTAEYDDGAKQELPVDVDLSGRS